MDHQHILLFGATGASGLAFISQYQTLSPSNQPYLTLYVRSKVKLSESSAALYLSNSKIRIVEGLLGSTSSLTIALTPPSSFPAVTTVVSFLGAYLSLSKVFTRDTSTPIADAFRSTVLPVLSKFNVERVLVLSTTTGFPLPGEFQSMPWKWWLYTCIPILFAPQGNAEMRGMASAVVEWGGVAGKWTVFRVPHLNDGNADTEVVAGTFLDKDGGFAGSTELSRGSLAKWVLEEVMNGEWIGQVVMLGNGV